MIGNVLVLWLLSRRNDQRGEGVVSTAIAVLIVAFLGAAMYVVFTQILNDSGSKASTTVNNIGGP